MSDDAIHHSHKTDGLIHYGTSYSIYTDANQTAFTPIVFIHGVGLNKAVWEPQVKLFSKIQCIITYDILGHGDSTIPSDSVTLYDYAKQLKELLDHLDINSAHIIGHSMGALISVFFTLN